MGWSPRPTLKPIPCADCGGRGPHEGPGHPYRPIHLLLCEVLWEDSESAITTSPPPWYARVIAYTSPNCLVTHPDAVFYHVIEIGRKEDLEWARQQIREFAGYGGPLNITKS